MEEMGLKQLMSVLYKKMWIIILITFVFTGVSGFISYYYLEPEYRTYTTLMIGRPREYEQGIEYDDVLLNQKLVSTYSEIAKSRIVANEFMSNLGLTYKEEELKKKIDVALVGDTEIIKITARDNDPLRAALIANELAGVFMKHVARIMNIQNVQIIDVAEVPVEPYLPRPVINMAIAGILGVILSSFFIILFEYLDNTVKTQEDVEKYFMVAVIGVVPYSAVKRSEHIEYKHKFGGEPQVADSGSIQKHQDQHTVLQCGSTAKELCSNQCYAGRG